FVNLPLIPVGQAIVSDKSLAPAGYPGHAEQVRKDASFRRAPCRSVLECQLRRNIPRSGSTLAVGFFLAATATSDCQKEQLAARIRRRALADLTGLMDHSALSFAMTSPLQFG